jgi:hypothetical protein
MGKGVSGRRNNDFKKDKIKGQSAKKNNKRNPNIKRSNEK